MPKKRKALTHAELMRAGIRNIGSLVESDGGQEKPTPEVEKLWDAVPQDIRQITRMTGRAKALLAVTFAQAKYWREQSDPAELAAASKRVADKVTDWQNSEKGKQARGKGARNVAVRFDWLDGWSYVHQLRAELKMSPKGLRKMIARLKIKLLKCPNKKRGPHLISRNDTLKVLDSRLKRKRLGEIAPAEMIWSTYAIDRQQTPGFARLKSILKKHGAKCEPRPDPNLTARPVPDLGDLSSLSAAVPVNVQMGTFRQTSESCGFQ